jgi:hypothetical protein
MTIDVERHGRDVGVRVRKEILILFLRELLSRQLGKRVRESDGRYAILSRAGSVGGTEGAILPYHIRHADVTRTGTFGNPRIRNLGGRNRINSESQQNEQSKTEE